MSIFLNYFLDAKSVKLPNEGIHVVLSGVRPNVRESLVHAGIDGLIGSDHICDHISKALALANRIAEESCK